jgi:hypothetical protein
MLFDTGLAKKFWAEAVRTAVYLRNVSMTIAVAGKTSFEAWHGFNRNETFAGIWMPAFLRGLKEKSRKWNSQAIQGIFIRYCSTTNGVYDPY